jgi:hypothetical protein
MSIMSKAVEVLVKPHNHSHRLYLDISVQLNLLAQLEDYLEMPAATQGEMKKDQLVALNTITKKDNHQGLICLDKGLGAEIIPLN